jgi:hypothetical protein
MGIKSRFSSYAVQRFGNVKKINTDLPVLLVVDGGSAAFNLSIGMVEKLLAMNISLLVVMDGCIDVEHAKGAESKNRSKGKIEDYTDIYCRPESYPRQRSKIGMCSSEALMELQALNSGPGYLHVYHADGEADIDVALFGSLQRSLLVEDLPNWGPGSDHQKKQLELLGEKLVYGVLAEDSDYILTEGLTYLKLTSLKYRPKPNTKQLSSEFYCEHYSFAHTAKTMELNPDVLADAACLLGNDFTVPQQEVFELIQQELIRLHEEYATANNIPKRGDGKLQNAVKWWLHGEAGAAAVFSKLGQLSTVRGLDSDGQQALTDCYSRARTHFTKIGCGQIRDRQQEVKLAAFGGHTPSAWHADFQRGQLPDFIQKQIFQHATAPFCDAGLEPLDSDMVSWFLPLNMKLAELVHASGEDGAGKRVTIDGGVLEMGEAKQTMLLPPRFSKNVAALTREWGRFDQEYADSAAGILKGLSLGSGGGGSGMSAAGGLQRDAWHREEAARKTQVMVHDAALVVFTCSKETDDLVVETKLTSSAPAAGFTKASELLAEMAVLHELDVDRAAGGETSSHAYSKPKQQIRDKLAAWCAKSDTAGTGGATVERATASPLSPERWEGLMAEGDAAAAAGGILQSNETAMLVIAQQAVLVLSTVLEWCHDQDSWVKSSMVSIDHLRCALMALLLESHRFYCDDGGDGGGGDDDGDDALNGSLDGGISRPQQLLPSRCDTSMHYFGTLVKRSLSRCLAADYITGHTFALMSTAPSGIVQDQCRRWTKFRQALADYLFERCNGEGGDGEGGDGPEDVFLRPRHYGMRCDSTGEGTEGTDQGTEGTKDVIEGPGLVSKNFFQRVFNTALAAVLQDDRQQAHRAPYTPSAACLSRWHLATAAEHAATHGRRCWRRPAFVELPDGLRTTTTAGLVKSSLAPAPVELVKSATATVVARDGSWQPPQVQVPSAILQTSPHETVSESPTPATQNLAILQDDRSCPSCLQPGDILRCALISSTFCGRVGAVRTEVLSFNTQSRRRLTGIVTRVDKDKIHIYCEELHREGDRGFKNKDNNWQKPGGMMFHRTDLALQAAWEAADGGMTGAMIGHGDSVSFELQRVRPSRTGEDYSLKVVRVVLVAKAREFIGTVACTAGKNGGKIDAVTGDDYVRQWVILWLAGNQQGSMAGNMTLQKNFFFYWQGGIKAGSVVRYTISPNFNAKFNKWDLNAAVSAFGPPPPVAAPAPLRPEAAEYFQGYGQHQSYGQQWGMQQQYPSLGKPRPTVAQGAWAAKGGSGSRGGGRGRGPCRNGAACTYPNCYFEHEGREGEGSSGSGGGSGGSVSKGENRGKIKDGKAGQGGEKRERGGQRQ